MAVTKATFNGNGSTTEFSHTIPYITKNDILVSVDGVDTTAYTWSNATTIKFNTAPPSGTNNVKIRRKTLVETAKAVYAAGSSIRATDLNNNQDQVLYKLQEIAVLDTDEIEDSAITSAKIADDTIVNADVNSAAAIAGTKIAPDFGSQNITTTGQLNLPDNSKLRLGTAADLEVFHDGTDSYISGSTGNLIISDTAGDVKIQAKHGEDSIVCLDDGAVDLYHDNSKKIATTSTGAWVGGNLNVTESITLAGTNLTSTAAELNQLDGKTITGTLTAANTNDVPTSSAVNSFVVNLLDSVGGFVAIADEVSFPNANPDPSDGVGTVVAISDAGGVVVNDSGVSTTGRTLGGSTVTITGFPTSARNTTLSAGLGLQVQTTSTLNTYTYHKLIAKEADVLALSQDINDFANRYRTGGTNPTSDNDDGDLFYNTSTNKLLIWNAGDSSWDENYSVGAFFINTLSSSSGAGGGSATFNGSATRFTLSNPPAVAQQLLVSVNGVVQKPNAGTSPSEGFAISGNDIIFASAPASGVDFFIITIGSSVTSVVADTVADSSITTAKIADNAVTTAKILDANVTTAKVADNAITNAKIATQTIGGSKLVNNTITATQIAANTITAGLIADDAVTAAKIADDAVTAAQIADNAVVTAAINADAVTGAKIADNAIDSEHYTDGSIDTVHIADGNVTQVKIAAEAIDEHRMSISNAGTNGQYLQKQSGNTGGLTWADVTVSATGQAGCVMFLRTSASNNSDGSDTFTGYKPDGTTISTSGTTTGGLQEALNYAANNGLDFFCHGGGIANRPDDTGTAGIPFAILRASSGSGMTNSPEGGYTGKSLSGGSGSGLVVTVVVAGGTVTAVNITTPGSGYNNNETVTLAANALYSGSPAFNWLVRTATDVGVLTTSATVNLPPSQNRSYHFTSFSIISNPGGAGTSTDPALKIDSGMMLDFDYRGQIGYTGIGSAVNINPTSKIPYDGLAATNGAIVDSNIRIDTVAYIGTSGTVTGNVLQIAGAVHRNQFTFGELNGSGYDSTNGTVTRIALSGLHLTNSEVNYNVFHVGGIHDTANSGLQIGSSASGVQPKGNHFTIGSIDMQAASYNAADSWGQYNFYDFYAAGSYTHAFKAQSSSTFERVNIRRAQGATGAIVNHTPTDWKNDYYEGNNGIRNVHRLSINRGESTASLMVLSTLTENRTGINIDQKDDSQEGLFLSTDHGSYTGNHLKIHAGRSKHAGYNVLAMDANHNTTGERIFEVRGDGATNADGAYTNNSADYAEYFESSTGSAIAVGTTVVLDNGKVRAATGSDSTDNIIGVVRPVDTSSTVGNAAWNNWNSKYLKDDFGQEQTESYTITQWDETKTDSQGDQYVVHHNYVTDEIPSGITAPGDATVSTTDNSGKALVRPKLNPSWDKTKTYVPRSERDEWCVVGLLGQIQITKGQPTGAKWIKMKDISASVELWYVR